MPPGPATTPAPRDPVLESLENAPIDDEPETDEEHRSAEEAREEPGSYSTEEVRRMLGLRTEQ
jgi:hypothetical protein